MIIKPIIQIISYNALKNIVLLFLFTLTCSLLYSQETDTVPNFVSDTVVVEIPKERHSPKKAAILSAVAPGAGQIYNQKYWKLPIVYGGLGGLSFWLGKNIKDLNGYKNAYRAQVVDSIPTASYKGISDPSELNLKRDQLKSSLDISIIVLSVFYALNIVDAAVDAHLFDYDVNEDITISFKPTFNTVLASSGPNLSARAGLSFIIQFK